MASQMSDLFKGFSKLELKERLERLVKMGALSWEEVNYLEVGGLQDTHLAEHFVENVIGYFQLPLGVATNFRIDGVDYAIPMAVEETSIIAAASKTAKWIREHGEITTTTKGRSIIGQIQVAKVSDFERFEKLVLDRKDEFIRELNETVAIGLVNRGGGVTDIQVRRVPRTGKLEESPFGATSKEDSMAVVHVLADAVDAMGANIMNQACEYLKAPIEQLTGEKVTMCILSNLVDTRLTCARVEMRGLDSETMERIAEASLFAKQDPYRAATNNKGVLNGMDPIVIATGNDWRAVEAGVHAFAARSGQYRSITEWRVENGALIGELIAPIIVGTVGGVTKLHPTAKICMGMMHITNASHLSRVIASVGLVQNLGALRALTSVGIIEGHMKLHIRNLTLGAGAKESEIPALQKRLEEILAATKRISLQNAVQILEEIRRGDRAAEL